MKKALQAEVSRWLRFAQEDLSEAKRMSQSATAVPRHAAWLAQQAAEKAIKAALIVEQIEFPRTHDLTALCMLVPDAWKLIHAGADLAQLSDYAVDARYPVGAPEITEEDAGQAVADAARIVEAVAAEIGDRLRAEQ